MTTNKGRKIYKCFGLAVILNMDRLKGLYDKLNEPNYCKYFANVSYNPTIGENSVALELLQISRMSEEERILIGYFGDEFPIRISYCASDARFMRETMEKLRIPNSLPSNLGEKVFYIFKGYLYSVITGNVYFEVDILTGKEDQLESVLSKLIKIYHGKDAQ